jgi:hypothetical protein
MGVAFAAIRDWIDEHEIAQAEVVHHASRGAEVARVVRFDQEYAAFRESHDAMLSVKYLTQRRKGAKAQSGVLCAFALQVRKNLFFWQAF